jgi:hypothetical protein
MTEEKRNKLIIEIGYYACYFLGVVIGLICGGFLIR